MRLLVCLLPVLPYTFNVHIRWLMVKVAVGTGGASTGQPLRPQRLSGQRPTGQVK